MIFGCFARDGNEQKMAENNHFFYDFSVLVISLLLEKKTTISNKYV
jgi:hypothetical protein